MNLRSQVKSDSGILCHKIVAAAAKRLYPASPLEQGSLVQDLVDSLEAGAAGL